jgi:DNA helicase-2/ATP-dependent DNA helicase PcrA
MAARVVWLVGTGQVAPSRCSGSPSPTRRLPSWPGGLRSGLQRAGIASTADGSRRTGGLDLPRLRRPAGDRARAAPGRRAAVAAARRCDALPAGRPGPAPPPWSDHAPDEPADHARRRPGLAGVRAVRAPRRPRAAARVGRRVARGRGADLREMDGQKGTKGHCDELRQMATAARRRRELASLVTSYRAAKADLDAIDFGDQVGARGSARRDGSPRSGWPSASGRRWCCSTSTRTPASPSAGCSSACSVAATRSRRSATRARPSTAGAARRCRTSTGFPRHFAQADGRRRRPSRWP